MEFVHAYQQGEACVDLFFRRYYDWLEFIGSIPLVQTPPTYEGQKVKF